jgi:hypothetical protein
MWIRFALALTCACCLFPCRGTDLICERMKPSIIVCSQDRRRRGAMSVSEAFPGVVDESVESTELASGTNGFHLVVCPAIS